MIVKYTPIKKRSLLNIIASVITSAILMVLTSNLATQYMARELRYVRALGEPSGWLNGKPYYAPLKSWQWLSSLISDGVYSQKIVIHPILILLAGFVLSIFLIYLGSRKQRVRVEIY